MKDKVFIDTNILVYSVDIDSDFHEEAKVTLTKLMHENDVWISRQILREYSVVMSRPSAIDKVSSADDILSDLNYFLDVFSIADETESVTVNLMDLIKIYNLKGKRIHDANIVATMKAYGINHLYTKNVEDFKNFKEIILIN